MENKILDRYLRRLGQGLTCSRADKARFLSQGQRLLEMFAEENPNCSYEDVTAAFGPPEVFAGEMLDTLAPGERQQARVSRRLLRRGVAAAAAAALLLPAAVQLYRQPTAPEKAKSSLHPYISAETAPNGGVSIFFGIPSNESLALLRPTESGKPEDSAESAVSPTVSDPIPEGLENRWFVGDPESSGTGWVWGYPENTSGAADEPEYGQLTVKAVWVAGKPEYGQLALKVPGGE